KCEDHGEALCAWVRSRQEQLEADLANAWSRDPLVLLQRDVHQRYAESGASTTRSSSIGKTGARGGSRTHMRKNPRRILSPQRLPFRHPGMGSRTKLTCRPRTLKANESGSRSILNPEFPLVFYRGLLSGATRRAYGW